MDFKEIMADCPVIAAVKDMDELEHLINKFQKFGQTSTQIILCTLLHRPMFVD